MRLLWAVPCRSVEVGPDGATIEGAGINRVTVEQLPADLAFTIALALATIPQDPDGNLEIHLLGPNMSSLETLMTDIEIEEGPGPLAPGFEMYGMLPVVIRFTAEQTGVHSVEIYIDGKHKQSLFFLIRVEGEEDAE